MEVTDIKAKYNELSNELKKELSRMQRSDRVFIIRDEIRNLQQLCPHDNGSFDFTSTDYCPYCGQKFRK